MCLNFAARFLGAFFIASMVAGPGSAETVETGTAGAWQLYRTTEGGQVVACHATMFTAGEQGMLFDHNIDQTSIGFMSLGTAVAGAPSEVEMWFDNNRAQSMAVSMPVESDGSGLDWRVYRSSNSEPDPVIDMLMNLSTVHFAYDVPGMGEQQVAFSLRGSSQMMNSTFQCVTPNEPAAAEAAVAQVGQVGQDRVIFGTCKLVVDGTTYVDLKGNCPIWMAGDGSGAFWINADRENYLGDYIAELVPAGDGTGSGHWNGEAGATHAQAYLGDDFRMASGGCWINSRAMICAAQ